MDFTGGFINDKTIAETLKVSQSWVRGQRHKRRHDLPHVLTIDPIMIASLPRYLTDEFDAWLETFEPANDNHEGDLAKIGQQQDRGWVTPPQWWQTQFGEDTT